MFGAIANEVGGWFLAIFGIKRGSKREQVKKRRKRQKVPYSRRHRR
jgi:hypothetical protein